MSENTIRLYTRQNEKTLYELNHKGRIINNRIYVKLHLGNIADFFLESYDWYTSEACKLLQKPDDVELPIWCSISEKNCLKAIEGTVVYILDVPKDEVLYFNDQKWDYVLNRLYLPKDEKDRIAYEDHINSLEISPNKLGLIDSYEFMIGKFKGMFPEEEKRIKESWKRTFQVGDLDNLDIFSVCGNLWEIKKEWVKHIVYPGDDLFKYI
ncbi:DUF3841 domain-containing protein [Terrisporobacter vanillatitrophus]|uniref:DUF3841 domain-containing protein n=1 Tax=Terrisporobacter vanillatitrophus TaxID=3058402 RepID=UPI0033668212